MHQRDVVRLGANSRDDRAVSGERSTDVRLAHVRVAELKLDRVHLRVPFNLRHISVRQHREREAVEEYFRLSVRIVPKFSTRCPCTR